MSHPCQRAQFLNLPGHHGGAYVLAHVESTADRADTASCAVPRIDFEIGDGGGHVTLRFAIDTRASA